MTHIHVLLLATVTWTVWIPACSIERLARGESGGVSIFPAPIFALAAWGIAYFLQALGFAFGVLVVAAVHLVLLLWMLVSIARGKRTLKIRAASTSAVD